MGSLLKVFRLHPEHEKVMEYLVFITPGIYARQ